MSHTRPATPPTTSAPRRVYAWAKSARELVAAELSTYKGQPCFTLRVTTCTPDGREVYTRSGLAMSVRHLPELEAAVRALRAAVDAGAVVRDEAPHGLTRSPAAHPGS